MYVFVVVQSLSHVQLFCDPMDCSKPGSSVHGILQARILEWVAISYSRGSSQPRGWTCVSPALAGRFFSTEPSGKPHVYVYIYINSFIPYNSPMIAVPFCTVLICNHLLKVTDRRLKISMQIQAYFPLHPVLLAIVDSWATIKWGELDSCPCCVTSRDNGKILSAHNIFKLPLPKQICLLYSEGTTGREVETWNAESQLGHNLVVWRCPAADDYNDTDPHRLSGHEMKHLEKHILKVGSSVQGSVTIIKIQN